MVPQCSVSFPQKIYFDSISFKFAGNDHISSRFTSDITYLKSSSWWPKMQNLENPRKKGRKEERVVAVLKDGKRLGRVPASQLKSTATIFIPYSIHWGSKLPFKPQCICTFFTFFRLEANLRSPPLLSPGISNAMYIVHGGQQTQTIWSVELSCIVELDSTIETHLW